MKTKDSLVMMTTIKKYISTEVTYFSRAVVGEYELVLELKNWPHHGPDVGQRRGLGLLGSCFCRDP